MVDIYFFILCLVYLTDFETYCESREETPINCKNNVVKKKTVSVSVKNKIKP